ncbi:MAG TPA: hypothetical protein VFU76_08250, partial [Terriglobales bacterium]|nr:hypothetical protein [Terriglobales bacterium]
QKHVGQCDVSANGVRFGAHLQDITAAWGGPDRHGSVGKRRWMMYNKGVQFDLDTRGRIEVIIVFNPE